MVDAVEHGRVPAKPDKPRLGSLYGSAWLLVLGTALLAAVLLTVPLNVPIGAMYWDTYTYYDAAGRMLAGQVPVRDFFTPAGPFGYAVATLWIWAFPNGQPALLLHWSTLTFTLPLIGLVLAGLPPDRRPLAPWLVLPFLLFSILPFNGKDFYPFPGSDGFAYYNRQTCLVLFALVAGLTFMRRGPLLSALVVVSMLVLFFLKITGCVAAALICIFALAAGRLRLTDAVIAALGFTAILAVIEVSTGLVSSYISDILVLIGMNSDTLLPRVFQALSINFGIAVSLGLLVLVLIAADRQAILTSMKQLARTPSAGALSAFADRPAFWLTAVTAAGIAFETQNTGSQAMIFIWPVLLWILHEHRAAQQGDRTAFAILALVGAAYLPLVVGISERAARTYIGAASNVALDHKNLGALGRVSARPLVVARARTMAVAYAENRTAFEHIAEQGELPSNLLYSDFDFQILYLLTLDKAIDAIRALEAKHATRFETLMALDFTNPAPWLMGRQAPRFVTVGSDPFRAVPPLTAAARASVSAVDLVLLPTCPPRPAVLKLKSHFAEPLAQHRRVQLTECYDAFLHPKFR